MKPEEYIISKLKSLSNGFPSIIFRYGLDSIINTHVIEITPEKEYYNNEPLDNAWFELVQEFYSLYPGFDICVISSDSTIKIDIEMFFTK